MSDWVLVPCLVQLRTEFNTIAPGRAKGADGSIGDTAHAAGGSSDHLPDEDFAKLRGKDADSRNEVHALDITTELNEPGLSLEQVVQFILARCRSGAERRLRYIIFNKRIWHVDEGWKQQTYTGTGDPHTGHAHFSASYDTAREASTASWHLEDIPVALSDEQIKDLVDAVWTKDLNGDAKASNLAYTTVFSMFQTVNRLEDLAAAQAKALDEQGKALAEIRALLATPPGK